MDAPGASTALQIAREHYRAGRLAEAEQACRQWLQLNPDDADALHLLGMIAGRIGRIDDALRILSRAAQLRPGSGEIRSALGTALFNLGRLDDSQREYDEAVRLSPGDFVAWHNLGVIFQRRGQLLPSAECFRKAVAIAPQSAIAHLNLGTMLRDLGRMQDAWNELRRSVEIDLNLADGHMMLAWMLLLHGDFRQGWREYEWRWRCPGAAWPSFRQPVWDGSPIAGRTLLLVAEQGLGDTIQFVRYADVLNRAGARVIVLCPSSLQAAVATVPGVAGVFSRPDSLPHFDTWLPMMSLPLRLGTTLQTIPANVPYVTVDLARAATWHERMKDDPPGFRVGICWAGNRANQNDENRSIPPHLLAVFRDTPGVTFYRLQLGEIANSALPIPLIDYTSEIRNFADTAAMMTHLDLVISVDTAVAHLAGAIGRPVWTLLPYAPEWRWLLSRSDSPWYPTMRLFRRAPLEPWEPVLHRVLAALSEAASRSG